MSIYDNIAFGPRTHGIHKKSQVDEIVEKSLKAAAIWDETKDRLKNLLSAFLAVSSRGSVLHAHLRFSLK